MSSDKEKEINVGGLFRLVAPMEASSSMDHDSSALMVETPDPSFAVKIYLFTIDAERERLLECRLVLEEHVRDVVGPPYQSSVVQVKGMNWVGWQAVTKKENDRFLINRCISSDESDLLLRIEYETEREPNPKLLFMLENIEILPAKQ